MTGIPGHTGEGCSRIGGTYTSYTNYNTDIVRLIEVPVTAIDYNKPYASVQSSVNTKIRIYNLKGRLLSVLPGENILAGLKKSRLDKGNSAVKIERAVSITQNPEIGRIVPEISNPNIKEIILKNYRIVYKITAK